MVRFAVGVIAGVLAWLAARADASAGATGWQVDEGLEPALVELVTASDVSAELEIRIAHGIAPEVAMAANAIVAGWYR
jgi:hypothetical protein